MNVLIVARTRMSGASRCIGGLASNGGSLRLLTAGGGYHDASAPFQVGQAWSLAFSARPQVSPPHVEDVLITSQCYIGDEPDIRGCILRTATPWKGGIDLLFGGVVGYTRGGNGYVCKRLGVPEGSTGFWIPDRHLVMRDDRRHYDYLADGVRRGLAYVGEAPTADAIHAGTLVRVSLARWWKPLDAESEFEERCYLQLSGWY